MAGFGMNEFDFTKCLEDSLNQLPSSDILLPWEQGVWKDIFKQQTLCIDPTHKLTRPVFHETPGVPLAEVPEENKRRKTVVKLVSGWVDIVRPGADVHWEEECEAKMQVALKRWLEACLMMPLAVGLRQLLDQQVDVQSQLRLMRNLLWRKAPATLIKRVNSLFRYLNGLKEAHVDFPGSESDLYQFLLYQQDQNVSPSRLEGVLESLRFCQHVLDIPELAELTSSRRCAGAAASKRGGPKRQASPFTVAELQTLHRMVCSNEENLWDRIFAGSVLLMVYTRSRWTDLQRAETMILDRDDAGLLQFVECTISSHKCVQSAVFRNVFLHAVAPCEGVVADDWAEQWISCREGMMIEVGKLPLMPAPNTSGAATRRPLSTEEMKLWTIHLLEKAGHDLTGRKISSHSCKCTMLSYAAKFGMAWDDRLVLGGHVGHLKSPITYSRDALARPLRLLSELLADIRIGRFQPDQTRSGRFVELPSTTAETPEANLGWEVIGSTSNANPGGVDVGVSEGELAQPVVISDEEQVKSELPVVSGPSDVVEDLDTSSCDALGNTSSSSDESAGADCPAQRLVRPPSAPEGYSLIQHSKFKTLHLLPEGHDRILACGRSKSKFHVSVDLMVRWDTPCCHFCWKKIRG